MLGKIVGGGLPLAAFGGRGEIMDQLAPAGHVYQAGTLSGNPLATAAGLSVLRRLRDPQVYRTLEERGATLEAGLQAAAGGEATVQRVGALTTVFLGPGPLRSLEQVDACDRERFAALVRVLLERGVLLPPSQYEAMFLSLAHGDEELALTVAAAREFFGAAG